MISQRFSSITSRRASARIALQLEKAYEKYTTTKDFDGRIPPPGINYNQENCRTLAEYIDMFRRDACAKEMPFLIGKCGLTPDSTVLDYGCGLGRLAYAASNYLTGGRYVGYEPNQQALSFLKSAYKGHTGFSFMGEELQGNDDYVGLQLGGASATGVAATDVDLSGFGGLSANAQYSSSVFTHMWIPAIEKVLHSLRAAMAPGGICVNSWLIVDSFAEYGMRCGIADRSLPHEVNGALTYSLANPLLCTAYRLDTVRDTYRRAGHEVLEILWGKWSGRQDHNGVHYQDLVVSRPC